MATPEQVLFITEYVRNQYPQYMGYMDIPEVAGAITDAMIRGASPAELEAAIYKTEYYKNTPATSRAFLLDRMRDPATAEQQITLKSQEIATKLGQLGIPYSFDELRNFALFQLLTGASDQTMMQQIVHHFGKQIPAGATALQVGGVLGDQMSKVKANAYDYAIKISDDQARFFSTGLITGAATQETVDDFMRDQAKMVFPFIADYLDQGYTVRQWADPYIQSAASELEINPSTIDLTDPKWGRVLQPFNDAPLSLYDWQRVIRTDASYGWDKTTGARTTASQLTTNLGRMFGAVGG